jgi:potassium-transporting ATPase KdpC subunit
MDAKADPMVSSATAAAGHTRVWRPALVLFLCLSVLTGLVYPLAVTGAAGALFPRAAAGSLIERDGKVVGSGLVGQAFASPAYFWSRPSATSPDPYNAGASGGSNLGPSAPALRDAVRERVAALRAADPDNTRAVPVDLVTASASGLDPHISRAAADYQASRIARLRGLAPRSVAALIEQQTEQPFLGFLGEPRVHVLRLNLALDAAKPMQ